MNTFTQKLTIKELKQFGITTGGIFVVLFGITVPLLSGHHLPTWPWIIAAVLWGLAFTRPKGLTHIYSMWMRIGMVLGKINTYILLSIMYTLIFIPIGIVRRISKKDPLNYQFKSDINSYRQTADTRDKNHMERPF